LYDITIIILLDDFVRPSVYHFRALCRRRLEDRRLLKKLKL